MHISFANHLRPASGKRHKKLNQAEPYCQIQSASAAAVLFLLLPQRAPRHCYLR